jgi:outer membrane receptor protein involved in Fe transport
MYQETYQNDFSNVRTARALDVVTDPSTGKPVCRSALNGTDPNCVPYNIWALGQVSPAALAYLQTPGFQSGNTTLDVLSASVTGDLTQYGVKLPTAKSGVGVAFGLERRTSGLELATDNEFSTGDLAGQGGPRIGVAGQYTVNDVFGEIRVPLADNQPFAYAGNLNVSARHSSYSSGNSADTYGTGVDWSPVKQFKLRGSYQQSARSPSVVEMYSAQSVGLTNMDSDPCAGATPSASLAQCAHSGVTAAQYGNIVDSPAQQYNALFGGNPTLRPEISKSKTLGFVATPVKDLSLSVDFFQINLDDAISTLPPTTVLAQCLSTGNPQFCSLITRDRNGTLWALPTAQITATNVNIGSMSTKGVDLGADYGFRMGNMGSMNVSFLGTRLSAFTAEPVPGLGSYDCAGYYGNTCGTPAPKWRHKLRGAWTMPSGLTAGLAWRYFGKVDVDASSSNPLMAGTVNAITATFPAMNYFDVSMSYPITKGITVTGTISNLFDKDPPLATTGAPYGNGNTFPVVYDALGRRIALNLTAKF